MINLSPFHHRPVCPAARHRVGGDDSRHIPQGGAGATTQL